MSDTVGDALPREMARVRDEVIPIYLQCGPGAIIAVTMMRASLDLAAEAMAEGDTVQMIRSLEALRGWNV